MGNPDSFRDSPAAGEARDEFVGIRVPYEGDGVITTSAGHPDPSFDAFVHLNAQMRRKIAEQPSGSRRPGSDAFLKELFADRT
jgi:hypothetical protein